MVACLHLLSKKRGGYVTKKPKLILFSIFLSFFAGLAQGETNKVGLLLPLSGKFAELGDDCKAGIDIALKNAGNLGIKSVIPEFVYADSVAESRVAVSEFRKLVEVEKVSSVLAVRASVGMPVNPLSKSSKIPLVGVVGHRDFASHNPFAYQYWSNSTEEGEALGLSIGRSGFTNGVLITTEDEWLVDVSSAFRSRFSTLNGKLSLDEKILGDELDFRAIISKIKRAMTEGENTIQFVIANIALQQQGVFIKQLREAKISLPVYVNFFFGRPEQIKIAGIENSEGVKFIEMSSSDPLFVSNLKAINSQARPNAMSLACLAGTEHIIQAYKIISTENGVTLKEAFDRIHKTKIGSLEIPVLERRAKFRLSLMEVQKGIPREVDIVVDPTTIN